MPRTDVGDIRDSDHFEIALNRVWRDHRGLSDRVLAGSVAVESSDLIDPHQSRHTVLAARLASLSEIEEDAGRSINAMARSKSSSDEPEQPRVFECATRQGVMKPIVIAATSPLRAHCTGSCYRIRSDVL